MFRDSSLQLRDRTRKYKQVKEVGSSNGWADHLVRIESHRAIVHSHRLRKPKSAIRVVGLHGVWNRNFYKASVATEIA
jgi:hypothetical protein